MSHLPGCQRASSNATYALYGTCTCDTIAQDNHTSALNRLADEMAAQRTVFVEPTVDEVALLRAENAALRRVIDEVPPHAYSTICMDTYEQATYEKRIVEWTQLRDATL